MSVRCAVTMKARLIVSLAVVSLAVAAPVQASSWHPEPPTYGVAKLANVPIQMRDGTVLRADVDVPVPPGHSAPVPGKRYPTLVGVTAYYKDSPVAKTNSYFVQRGYAVVLADVRGTGSSGGQWQMLGPLEAEDGVQVIDWAARQPWSDGRIGLSGSSYGAISQLLIMERPDAPRQVKAILPVAPMADPYRDLVFHGGAFDDEFMGEWLGLTSGASLAPSQQTGTNPSQAALTELQHLSGLDLPTNAAASGLTGGPIAYDGPFWQARAPIAHLDRIKVPTMIIGGEFDIFQRGEPLLFQNLRVHAKRLIIGPWTHSDVGSTLPANGIPSRNELELQWYDQYVKGERTGIARAPKVEQYRLEGSSQSHFVSSSTWPLPGIHPLDLYLSGARSGSARSLNDGSLELGGPTDRRADLLPYDPSGTPCTRATFQWGNEATSPDEASTMLPCEGDQRIDELQQLTYTTRPLTHPLTIDGPIDLHLVARSPQHANTVFSVTLTDVAPDGTSVAITGGWLVASQRAIARSPWTMAVDGQPLRVFHPFAASSEQSPPAAPAAYDIEIFPTFARFQPGHRLRLDIGTGQLPHLVPTAPEAADSVGGTFLIDHATAGDSSHLVLPEVIPASQWRHNQHRHVRARARRHRKGGAGRPIRARRRKPRVPASLIAYGISPAAALKDLSSATGQAALRQLDYLRGKRPLLVHLYLPWNGYPQNLPSLDAQIAALAAHRFKVDVVLRYAPPNGHDGDLAGYAQFVQAVVHHFARQPAVVRLGITNESNFGLDKRGALGGADGQYTDPLGALIAGMDAAYHQRAHDHAHMKLGFNWAYRGCDQSSCGPTADIDYWTELARRGGARFAREVDWVSMDIYPGTIWPPGDPAADAYQPGLSPAQEVASAIEVLRYQLMPLAGLGAGIPIGIQEISWATLPPVRSDAQQASLLQQFAAGACEVAARTNFRTFYWFTLDDPPASSPSNLNFGLYNSLRTAKPAAAAYQEVIQQGCR